MYPEPRQMSPAQLFDERSPAPEKPMPDKTPADYYNEHFRPKATEAEPKAEETEPGEVPAPADEVPAPAEDAGPVAEEAPEARPRGASPKGSRP